MTPPPPHQLRTQWRIHSPAEIKILVSSDNLAFFRNRDLCPTTIRKWIPPFLFVVEPCYSEEMGHVTFSLLSLVTYKYVLPCLALLFKGSWEKCSEDRYSKYYICWICYDVCLVGQKCRLDELLFNTGARGQDKCLPWIGWLIGYIGLHDALL